MFQLQKTSTSGTAIPAVARTVVQGAEILKFCQVEDGTRDATLAVLQELQRHLLRCHLLAEQLTEDVRVARAAFESERGTAAGDELIIALPAVADVQSKAEMFLQSIKLAIAQTAQLVKPFYGVSLDHRYHKFVAWAAEAFGRADEFTKLLENWEPWVKTVVDMRNAVDHPTDGVRGRLQVRDFTLTGTSPLAVRDPEWCLTGEYPRPMVVDMTNIVEGVLELSEEVLAALFDHWKKPFPIAICEVPVEQRDANCPVRLRVGLAAKATKGEQP